MRESRGPASGRGDSPVPVTRAGSAFYSAAVETGLQEGNNATDGTRVVLAAGVSLDPVRHEGPPPLDGGLDPLDEAPEHSAAVAEALAAFGYRAWPSRGDGEPPNCQSGCARP